MELKRHDFLSDTTVWPRPDYSMNAKYPVVREAWRVQEKSDIGAGTVPAGKLAITTNTDGEIKGS
ncbi:MAG: hypothetical protein MZV63_55020 [Marinilabiliales bacterium]|nr:hypothetical protein [Marinilabiliales bacterium]